MSTKAKLALFIAVILWASAFVAIRIALQGFSPAGLALSRFIVASIFISFFYFKQDYSQTISLKDKAALGGVGIIGIGIYTLMLNYGEITVSSGMASFIISQSPIITAIIAIFFLNERLTFLRMLGLIISVIGMLFITLGKEGHLSWHIDMTYMLIATLAGSFYTILQKPFLKKYHAMQATAYVIWGGTLFLSFYLPILPNELKHASWSALAAMLYLGLFPGVVGYLAWTYALIEIPASRATTFLYFMPVIASGLGWMFLGEVPVLLSLLGGVIAMFGVWLVNHSYQTVPTR